MSRKEENGLSPAILYNQYGGKEELRMEEDMEFMLQRDVESEAKFQWPPAEDGDHPAVEVKDIPGFVRSKRVCGLARKYCWQNLHVGHRVSDLVIREYAGENYLAAFVTCFDNKSNDQHLLYRPYTWLLMNFKTGEIIRILETNQEEFCDAPYETPLNPLPDATYDLSEEHFRMLYSILDEVRIQYLKGKGFRRKLYKEYMDEILSTVPNDFHVFFESLSKPKR